MVVAVLVVVAIVGVVAAVVFRFYVYRKKSEEPFQFGGHTGGVGERRLWRVGLREVGANWTKYGCLVWGVLSLLMVAGVVVAILTGLWPTVEGP